MISILYSAAMMPLKKKKKGNKNERFSLSDPIWFATWQWTLLWVVLFSTSLHTRVIVRHNVTHMCLPWSVNNLVCRVWSREWTEKIESIQNHLNKYIHVTWCSVVKQINISVIQVLLFKFNLLIFFIQMHSRLYSYYN